MNLRKADIDKLVGVDQRLQAVVFRVAFLAERPFLISEGLRTPERQRLLYAQKKTKTLNSKHIIGHAVDCYPTDTAYSKIAQRRDEFTWLVDLARVVSHEMRIPMTFGYDWGWDAPHWELKT